MKWFFWILVSLVLSGCGRYEGASNRKLTWANAVKVPGVENAYRVSPALFRGEQPTSIGMKNLERLGIKTVVSLRAFHSDRDLIEGTDLDYERITFQTWDPEEDELIRFLKIATDSKRLPVLVHCLHGSDRTGAMCAAYRIVVEEWSKEDAIREMKSGGYGHHKIWIHLESWIEELDVERLKAAIGLSESI
jgi:protein tyrosine/serine phosphatase